MPKKLIVNASVCDTRSVQEETLAACEQIRINAGVVITNARSRALLARYPVHISTSNTLDLADETVELRTVNGSAVIGSEVPAATQYLLVNGKLELTPESAPALERYAGIEVNGLLRGPRGLVEHIRGLHVNGKTETWPDGAVPLKRNIVLDRFFPLRAHADRYWCDGTLFALDPALAQAAAPLTERGVRLEAQRAVLAESLVPVLGPLLAEQAELLTVPDGTVLVKDDAVLDTALLRRGTRLLIHGSLAVPAGADALLPRIEYLRVLGEVLLAQELEEAFAACGAHCHDIRLTHGTLIWNRDEVQLGCTALESAPEGLTVARCDEVQLAPDIPPELLRQRLWLLDCDEVFCTPAQRDALLPNSRGVDEFETEPQKDHDWTPDAPRDADTVYINAAQYVL